MKTFAWLIRRELWENRSLYWGPIVAAAIAMFGIGVAVSRHMTTAALLLAMDDARRHTIMVVPYAIPTAIILVTSVIVGWIYCLDALHDERRDRSILFWKSLPVSDRDTVLAKMAMPMLVVPAIAFAVVTATQWIMLAGGSILLAANGLPASLPWTEVHMFQDLVVLAYGVLVVALWNAPVYAWLVLVSGWANRAVLAWAILPPLALCVLEKLVFDSDVAIGVLKRRLLMGEIADAFAIHREAGDTVLDRVDQLTPLHYLSNEAVWGGLLFAAIFTVAAIYLRRTRDPL